MFKPALQMHKLQYTVDKSEKLYSLWNLELTFCIIKMYGKKCNNDYLKLLKENVKLKVDRE